MCVCVGGGGVFFFLHTNVIHVPVLSSFKTMNKMSKCKG